MKKFILLLLGIPTLSYAQINYTGNIAITGNVAINQHFKRPAGGSGPSGSLFVEDSFTDTSATELSAHTGETGATWTKHPSYAQDITVSDSNDAISNQDTAHTAYYASGSPTDADYTVSADFITESDVGSHGVIGRVNTTEDTFYMCRYQAADHTINLSQRVNGVGADIDDPFSYTASGTFNLRLEMVGDQIKCYKDDVEILSATDSNISAAGKAGIRIRNSNNTTGVHVDNLEAQNWD